MCSAPLPTPEDFELIVNMLSDGSESKQRRVRFSTEVSRRSSPAVKADLKQLWYNPQDLASFKRQARMMCASGIIHASRGDDSVRGLESCTLERQYWRHQTIQATLSAHKKGMSSDDMALVSRKCTVWNEEVAFMQACHDYCSVYQPNMNLPLIPAQPPKFPFELKRTYSGAPSRLSRRVRRRTL